MNNLSCIPFYKTKDQQDFRLWYAYGEKYPLYVPSDYLLPFFFPIPYNPADQRISVEFYKACCTEEQYVGIIGSFNNAFSLAFAKDPLSLTEKMQANGLRIIKDADKGMAMVVYSANAISNMYIREGVYYLKITISTDSTQRTYFSDVFFVRDDLSSLVRIDWNNEDNLEYNGGYIPYSSNFRNRLYLDTTIGMPEYKFTEEGEERNGRFFPIKQLSEKVYKMTFFAPEYLCDVMRLIRMSDYITINDGLGRTYDVEQFEMEVNWSQGGHYAEVSCSFQTDSVVKKIGKAYSI